LLVALLVVVANISLYSISALKVCVCVCVCVCVSVCLSLVFLFWKWCEEYNKGLLNVVCCDVVRVLHATEIIARVQFVVGSGDKWTWIIFIPRLLSVSFSQG
jgi:hypothetical protein